MKHAFVVDLEERGSHQIESETFTPFNAWKVKATIHSPVPV
jgi:hypothetical protein